MSLESTERAICAALNAADEKVGIAAEALVGSVLELGANNGVFPVTTGGIRYIVQMIPACLGENCKAPIEEHSAECQACTS